MKKIRMAFFAIATLTLLATSTGCGGGGGGGSDDDDTPVAESGSTGGSGAESGTFTGTGNESTSGSGTGGGSSESGSGNPSTGTGNGSTSPVTVSEATTTVTILPYTNSAIADKVFYRTKEDGKIKYHLFNGGKCYESSNSDYFSNEDDDHPIIISWNGNVYRLDPDKINLRINGSGLFSTFQHGDGGDDAIMTFNSNGSGTIDADGKNIPLTFTNNAGVLTLSFTYEGKPATALFAYDGTKLYAIDDDLRLIFVKNYDSGSGSGSSSEVTVSEATTTVTILPYTNSAIADKVFYRTKENGKTKYYLFNGGKCYESSNSDSFSKEDDDHSTIISWNGNIYLSGTAKINSRISGSGLFASFQQGAGGDNAIMTFNSNGSGSISVDGETIPFTFTNNAGVLTISYTYQGTPDTMLFAYDGTKLYNIDEDIHLIFVKNYSSGSGSGSTTTSIPAGFVAVPGATFDGTTAITDSEVFIAGRTVTIPSLLVCDHEVTQGEYEQYCSYGGSSPSTTYGKGSSYPAYDVSWYDALVYCNKRSLAEGRTPCYKINGKTNPSEWGKVPTYSNSPWDYSATCDFAANGYRLPTEAEWEYLARGGNLTNSGQTTYSGSGTVGSVAWYSETSGFQTHEVKKKAANALGLYDMSGNVWEWCWDKGGPICTSTPSTGTNSKSGFVRVARGGSWFFNASVCTVSRRDDDCFPSFRDDNYGFRVVCSRSE